MFQLFFGIIWESIVSFITIVMVLTIGRTEPQARVFLLLFLGIFHAVGIGMLAWGIKEFKKIQRIKTEGIPFRGHVVGMEPDYRERVNNQPKMMMVVEEEGSGQLYRMKCGYGDRVYMSFPEFSVVDCKKDPETGEAILISKEGLEDPFYRGEVQTAYGREEIPNENQMVFCQRCASANPWNAKFCNECGAPFER